MKNKRTYIVTFEVHADCTIYFYVFHCMAYNAKEACAIAKEAWSAEGCKNYQFHIHGVKSQFQNHEHLCVRSYTGRETHGEDVMDKFFITDLRVWRINGRNLYGV